MALPGAAEDHDVGELLALIDELYAPPSPPVRGRKRPAAALRKELEAQVEELQRTLDAVRPSSSSPHVTELAELWQCIARRQLKQRETVVRENALLKRTARRQQEIARRIVAKVLQAMQSILPPATTVQALVHTLPSAAAPPLLMRRLDAACEHLAARAVHVDSSNTRAHDVQWDEAQSALRFCLRSSGQYPFKLSRVADEVWRLMLGQTPGPQTRTQDEIYFTNSRFQLRKPFGHIDVQGPSVIRRVFTQDGGVLVVSVAIQKGTESDAENENLMAGAALHETMWVRVVRANASNPQSPVFVESGTESDVFAITRSEIIDDDAPCDQTRFRQLRAFIEGYAVEDRGGGQQKLENRLLDTSLLRGQAGILLF